MLSDNQKIDKHSNYLEANICEEAIIKQYYCEFCASVISSSTEMMLEYIAEDFFYYKCRNELVQKVVFEISCYQYYRAVQAVKKNIGESWIIGLRSACKHIKEPPVLTAKNDFGLTWIDYAHTYVDNYQCCDMDYKTSAYILKHLKFPTHKNLSPEFIYLRDKIINISPKPLNDIYCRWVEDIMINSLPEFLDIYEDELNFKKFYNFMISEEG